MASKRVDSFLKKKFGSTERKLHDKTILGEDGEFMEEKSYQQLVQNTWEIPKFKRYFDMHMENEESDGEISPIRSWLIQNGKEINLPTVFMAHLYMTLHTMHDDNDNLQENDHILMELNIRLEDSNGDPQLFYNFTFTVSALSVGTIGIFRQPISAMKSKQTACLPGWVDWTKLQQKLGMEESLFVTVTHYIYTHPMEWGMSSKAVDLAVTFMCNGELDCEKPYVLQQVIDKASELKLTGITEAITSQPKIEPACLNYTETSFTYPRTPN